MSGPSRKSGRVLIELDSAVAMAIMKEIILIGKPAAYSKSRTILFLKTRK